MSSLFRRAQQPLRQMSFLPRAALRQPARTIAPRAAASFHTSGVSAKESDHYESDKKKADEVERKKQEQMKNPERKEELSSDSEEAIKAERNEHSSATDDTKKLQRETEDKPAKKHGQA